MCSLVPKLAPRRVSSTMARICHGVQAKDRLRFALEEALGLVALTCMSMTPLSFPK
jgi:hypothetical protein